MEFVIIEIIILISIITLKYIFNYNLKELKHIADDEYLDDLAKKYPSNIDICKEYLKKLNNEKVKIEEDEDIKASLYIAITDKILIANIQNSYTRIQTIAHECLHSIQDRKLLIFNFIFSNIYLLYFILICILTVLRILPFKLMFLSILFIFSIIYYMVKTFLENDAMIKAEYFSKEYMKEKNISSEEEIEALALGFKKINLIGIKCINYKIFTEIMIKVFLFIILCLIF